MNDFDKLKSLLSEVRAAKTGLEKEIAKVNELYETFEDMNFDCDEELEEIDERLEELQDDLDDGEGDEKEINSEIETLKKNRVMVEEAVDILEQLQEVFESIAEINDELDIG